MMLWGQKEKESATLMALGVLIHLCWPPTSPSRKPGKLSSPLEALNHEVGGGGTVKE
jgi:hypothetical protein